MRENMGMHRGKRLDNGEWVYGYYVKSRYYEGGYTHFIIDLNSKYDDYDSFYLMYPVDPDTVGADTGLTDKNGTRIYEGDIVRFQFDNDDCPFPNKRAEKHIRRVFWQKFRACFAIAMGNDMSDNINNDLWKYVQNGNRVEVIGNI